MNAPVRADILLAGSSGLIGALILKRLLAAAPDNAGRIFAPLRRASQTATHNFIPIVTDRDVAPGDATIDQSLATHAAQLGSFVCALGTTMERAGSQQAFAAVDHDLVLRLADLALRHGASQAIVVSSVGADAASRNFYLRTKGRMERDLSSLGFDRCDFLHPGLLLGPRGAEKRFGESIAQSLAPLYNPLLLGPLRRYRAIAADTVAAAAVDLLQASAPGVYRHEFDQLTQNTAG